MVPSTLQQLLRNQSQSSSKIVALFRQHLPPFLPVVPTHIPKISKSLDSLTSTNLTKTDFLKPNYFPCGHVHPSFSFELFVNPMSSTSLIRSQHDEDTVVDDSHIIKADSVKKKRKKKMNKHKLRKLRKRLRKKT